MKKIISDKTIYFYDENNNEVMYMDHSIDECIWYFNTDTIINITEDMELYNLINDFMNNVYVFNDDILFNYKDGNRLIWYSDCYYDSCDEWSIASVSCLNIERGENCFKIWCTKKLDEMLERKYKTYGICFSPAGNGRFSKNLDTNLTLQDDFVIQVYQPLLSKNKTLVR